MLYLLLTFIGGIFIGSFLNLVADRVVNGGSILFGRSQCDNCKHLLGPKDLIPLLSFINTKGKCRYCGIKLSFYYPLSEILTGLAFMGVAAYVGLFNGYSTAKLVSFAYISVIACIYIILFLTDIKYRLIPDKISFFGISFVLLFTIGNLIYNLVTSYNILKNDDFGKYLIQAGFWTNQLQSSLRGFGIVFGSAFLIGFFFWLLVFLTRGRGMGGGDIKLGFLIGLVNGFPYNIAAIFLGFLLGSIFSVFAILLRKKSIKDTIPFGPFLILGSVLAFVWGPQLVSWYLGLFGRS